MFDEVLLLLGFPLDAKREQVPSESANTVWHFAHRRVPQGLLLCLDEKIELGLVKTVRGYPNHTFVCRDEALSDAVKTRLYDTLKQVESTFKVL